MALVAPIPTGTITLLFTDIEGSTQRWEEWGDAMLQALRRHDELLRAAIERHGGHVFKTIGDAFCAAFWRAPDGVAAAIDAQRALAAENWNAIGGLSVRMALHSGATDEREGDYFGPAVNRVARLLATAHGGQVVFSGATALLLRGLMADGTELFDLGQHRLADLAEAEHVWQLVAPGLAQTFPPLRSLKSMPNNLPHQLTPLIGRDDVLAEVGQLIDDHALVTLVGTGGIGKTRVALQVGANELDGTPDGVWFVDLAPIGNTSLVASTITTALGLREQPQVPLLDTLLRYLKHKHVLLILDNCEHVIEAVAKITDAILRACPEVRLLATSREALRIGGEYVYPMPSLTFPLQSETLAAEQALSYGAVALFAQRAAASDAKFELTDDSAPIVAEICRRLDGIALAIELAAARVKVLAPRHLAQKLDERFRVLTGGSRAALPRQQTMRALIDWSYDLLSAKEQRLFRWLAIFSGGWTLEMAAVVCADDKATEDVVESWEVLDLLSSLVDKSLVHVDQSESGVRYRLLESMRQYGHERLADAGEDAVVAKAHAVAFLALGEELHRVFETTPEHMWLARAEPELDNFRAALTWAFETHGDVRLGQRLAAALLPAWTRFVAAEGLRWIQAASTHATEMPASLEAALDLAEAAIATALSQPKTARERAERALALYNDLGNHLRIAQARHLLGRALVHLGEAEEGETMLTAALNEARATGVHSVIADVLQSLAIARSHAGDVAGARPLFAEALAMFRSVSAERVCSHIAGNLAEAEFHEGNALEALQLENEALASYRRFNHKLGTAISLCNIAAYLIALGRYEEARISARDGLAAARDTQWEVGVAWGLQHLAATAALRPADDAGDVRGDRPRAARILGYVDARLDAMEALRQYTEKQEQDKSLSALRASLGEDQLAKLMAEGATWTEDQAFGEALAI
ncbi:MAG TPA: tetratricopeptide repeat protein [Candidatus Cybelea sp.]|jgi:predicted ATPase/class 3 adenylate cyclase|nr:tetratricopeptide repeat protein [Candidatus Cybelea sp.]